MRRFAWVLVPLLVLAACGNGADPKFTSGRPNASCVAPYLNDQPPNGRFRSPPPTVHPGDSLTVYGHWYTSTCNDTGTHDPVRPLPPVHLTVRLPGGKTAHLGPLTPGGRDMGFKVLVRIPAAARSGTATIRDDRTPYPADFRFTIDA